MDTFLFIIRIVFLLLSALVGLIHILFQFYQKIPNPAFKLAIPDYLACVIVALCMGFAFNSYYALLAFIPLILIKYLCSKLVNPRHRHGYGFWLEIDWRFLAPRGFENFQQHRSLMSEMNKMPKSTHFILPRFYALIFIYFIKRRLLKDVKNKKADFSATQMNTALGEFSGLIERIVKLQKAHSEKKEFPFGVLKINRL